MALICGHTWVGRGFHRVGTHSGELTCLQGLVQLGFSSPVSPGAGTRDNVPGQSKVVIHRLIFKDL